MWCVAGQLAETHVLQVKADRDRAVLHPKLPQGRIAGDVAWLVDAELGTGRAGGAGGEALSCALLVLLLVTEGDSDGAVAGRKAAQSALLAPTSPGRNGLQWLLRYIMSPEHADVVVDALSAEFPGSHTDWWRLNGGAVLPKTVAWLVVRRVLPNNAEAVAVCQALCMQRLRNAQAYVGVPACVSVCVCGCCAVNE